ncbi:hypothetical protein PoB_001418600 [Plakobranchus ocellatus]|uniref:Uncharacterized protein n=1 Tax=Plakobranchus ocellatus TaxID=259542 RepID=A0AAV3YK99_9GAST|nr:hypothetical protein PoB_001418600 [Plakobranchus ocellatus]
MTSKWRSLSLGQSVRVCESFHKFLPRASDEESVAQWTQNIDHSIETAFPVVRQQNIDHSIETAFPLMRQQNIDRSIKTAFPVVRQQNIDRSIETAFPVVRQQNIDHSIETAFPVVRQQNIDRSIETAFPVVRQQNIDHSIETAFPVVFFVSFKFHRTQVWFLCTASPQQCDLRLLGPASGQVAGGGARTRDRRIPAVLRANSVTTVPSWDTEQ